MRTQKRIFAVACLLASVVAGTLVGAVGCIVCDCLSPDEVTPLSEGPWKIVRADVDDVVGGTVEVVGDEVRIRYDRADGTEWVVTYAVTDRFP